MTHLPRGDARKRLLSPNNGIASPGRATCFD
jgi:hypothetical protein